MGSEARKYNDESDLSNEVTIIRPDRGITSSIFVDIWKNRELIKLLALKEVKRKYKNTQLGIFWAIIQPLLYMLVLNTFFGLVRKFQSSEIPYTLHLLTGLVAFQFFTKCINSGSSSLSNNAAILGKIHISRIVFPASSLITAMIEFIFPLLLLIGFLAYYRVELTVQLVAVPVIFLFLFIAGASMQLFMSVTNIRFQDAKMLVPIITQLWFFATPVFYPLTIVPEKYRWIVALNPVVGIVESFRWSVLGLKQPPDFGVLMMSGSVIILGFIFSCFYFNRLDRVIYKYL